MTAVAIERPAPPRRVVTVVGPLAAMTILMAIVGVTSEILEGSIWGLFLGLSLVFTSRLARFSFSSAETTILGITFAVAGALTYPLFYQAAELLTPWLSTQIAAIWLVLGGVVAWIVNRRRPDAGAWGLPIVWALTGLAFAPLATAVDQFAFQDGILTSGAFIVSGIAVAMIGGAATLARLTDVRGIAIIGGALVMTWFAGAQVGFTLAGLIDNLANIANIPDFWPPDFAWAIGEGVWWNPATWDFGSPRLPNPLIETFRIGILSSVLGCLVALPVAFMASSVTAPNRITYLFDKGFMNIIRTIPDLFWAMIFVAGVGGGPFAGVLALFFFSLAIMSKLLSETVDAVDTGPLEAAKSTGSSHFPAVRAAVLPEVLPNYVAYALYVFEISIRASVVIGLVGAGGIGRVIEAQRVFFQFDRVFAIVIVMLVIVFVIEQVSVYFRRKLV